MASRLRYRFCKPVPVPYRQYKRRRHGMEALEVATRASLDELCRRAEGFIDIFTERMEDLVKRARQNDPKASLPLTFYEALAVDVVPVWDEKEKKFSWWMMEIQGKEAY